MAIDPNLLAQLEDEDTIPPEVLPLLEDEDPPKEPTVQEPPQEFEHTYIDAYDMTVATPKGLPIEERDKLLTDFVSLQYVDPYAEEAGKEGQSGAVDIKGPEPEPTLPFSSTQDMSKRLKDMGGAIDNVPTPTEVSPETNTAMALSYVPRRVAGHMEKAAWAAYEGGLRAERALYQYAPNRIMDTFIKGEMKEARIGRLNRQIEYWMKPEKYGWVSPQVDEDKRLNDETAFRVNTYYGYANLLAEAGIDFTSFVAELGMMPGAGMAATEYAGKALPYLAKNAAHAVATMAPYALAATSGGIFPRLHSALILTSFGLVKPIVNLTGFRKLTATGIAAILNSALTHQDIMAAYKENGGFNQKFFKVFVPWIVMNVGFAVYLKDTPVAERNQIRNKGIKMMANDAGTTFAAGKYVLKVTERQIEKAETKPRIITTGVAGDAQVIQVPKDFKESSPSAAGVTEPTTPEAALPPKQVDYKIPEKVLTGEPETGKGSRSKQVYPEWKNADTRDGLLALKSELESLEKSEYGPTRDENGSVVDNKRVKLKGESPEHLRDLKPKKSHGTRKADLGKVQDAIDGKPQTKVEHDRVVDLLTAQEAHENRRMQDGQDYYEGKSSERPVDPDVNEELLKATEPPPDIADMTAAEYEAYQKKRKSVGAAGEEVTGEIPLPDLPNEVEVITLDGTKKTIRPKEDEAFSIVPIKGADGKVRYQLHDGQVYDIAVSEANKLMEYAGVKEKNKKYQQDILAMTENDYVSQQGKKVSGQSVKKTENLARTYYRYLKSRESKSVGAKGLKPGEGNENNPHYQAVKKALEAGKTVRPEVLADYPDLQKKYGTKPHSKPPKDTTAGGRIPLDPRKTESQFARDLADAAKQLDDTKTGDVAAYFKSDMEKQSELADNLMAENPGFFEKVAVGEAEMPQGSELLGISVYVKAINNIKNSENPGETALKLANSPFAEQISQAGSTLSSLSHLVDRDELDPIQAIKKIQKSREKSKKNVINKDLTLAGLEEKLRKAEERAAKAEKAAAERIPSETVEKAAFGAKNKIFTKKVADEASAKLREKLMGLRANIDPTAMIEVVKIGGFYAEGGVREFKAWSDKMVTDFGEKIKPYLADAWKQINDKFQKDTVDKAMKQIQEIVTQEGELSDLTGYLKKINEYVQSTGVKGQENILNEVYKIVQEVAPKMTKSEVRDALSGYGKYRLLSKDELKAQIRDINGQWQQIAKLEDLEKRQSPKKTGAERRTPTDEERALIKQVNELKKKYNIQTTDPATQLKSSLDAIKTRLNNQIADLDKEISTREKIVKTTTPPPSDAEVVALRKTRDALKIERDKIFFSPMSDAKRVELATKAAERTVSELERRINEGDLSPVTNTQSAWSPEISRLKMQAGELRDQISMLKEMMNPSMSPEERALNTLKRRIQRNTENLQDRINNLDFAKKPKTSSPMDAEAAKLKAQENSIRDAYNASRKAQDVDISEANELVRLSTIATGKRSAVAETSPVGSPERMEYGRAKSDFLRYADTLRHRNEKLKASDWKVAPLRSLVRALAEVPGVMKATVASVDDSSLLNQGFKIGLNNPKVWSRNAVKTFIDIYGTLKGEDMLRELNADIYSRPNYINGVYKKHGVYFGSEESFPTSILAKTPYFGKLFEASETAYTGFIHRNRADIFDFYHDQFTKKGLATEGLGELVNSITGRGNMGAGEKISDVINVVVFSGRYLKSNIDMLTGHASAWPTMSPGVRNKAIKNTVVAYAAIIGAAYLAKAIGSAFDNEDLSETDWRSSAAGKLKLGNTTMDYTGGASTLMTLVSRMSGGIKNERTGIISPVWSKDKVAVNAWDLLGRFVSGKFAPFTAAVRDFFSNSKDWEGEPLDIQSTSRFAPITPSSAVEGFVASEGNLPTKLGKAAAIAVISGLGGGVKTKEEEPDQMVKDAKSIEKELARMDKVGDYEGKAALESSPKAQRIVMLAGQGSDLRRLQEEADDVETQIKDARNDMRTDPVTKAITVEILEADLKIRKEYIDSYFNEIK